MKVSNLACCSHFVEPKNCLVTAALVTLPPQYAQEARDTSWKNYIQYQVKITSFRIVRLMNNKTQVIISVDTTHYHSSLHFCPEKICFLFNGTSELFRPIVPRVVNIKHTRHVKNNLK